MMLLHQGAAAFTLWTGQPAPLELMQAKLAEARAGGLRSAEGEPAGDGRDAGSPAEGEPTPAGDAGLTGGRRATVGPMGAFRFLTAGESHGPALGVTVEGVPAGLRADRRRPRGRPRPPPARLRPRRAPGDRARPGRDPRPASATA